MKRYKNDPRWIEAKFGFCTTCQKPLKGTRAWYYPATHDIFCEKCAESHVKDFNSAVEDEEFYESLYGRDRYA